MKATGRAFPHPVVCPLRDDVADNDVALTVGVGGGPSCYRITAELAVGNEAVRDLVASGRAAAWLHIEGSRCFHRSVHRFPAADAAVTVEIPVEQIEGTIELLGVVAVAGAAIADYAPSGCHDDYGGAVFHVRPGDILAMSRTETFEADRSPDPLKRRSSILVFRPAPDDGEGFRLVFDEMKLTVELPPVDFARFHEVVHSATDRERRLLLQGLALPAMAAGIVHLATRMAAADGGGDDGPGTPMGWEEALRERLAALGSAPDPDPEEALLQAQNLLGNPTTQFLEGILKGMEEDGGDES